LELRRRLQVREEKGDRPLRKLRHVRNCGACLVPPPEALRSV
jgi:hypothetical protein